MTISRVESPVFEQGPSLLTMLALVEKRPSMYLGYDESHRAQQLDALESFIAGYCAAVHHHGLIDAGYTAYARFPDYLRNRFGWSMSCGPIAAIREHSDRDAAAWDLFWTLLWDAQQPHEREAR